MLLNQCITNFLYFALQYISYTPLIFLTSNHYVNYRKCAYFALSCAFCATMFNMLVPDAIASNIFNIFILILFSTLIFDLNKSKVIIFSIFCALILFFTNIFCISFNIFVFSNQYVLYYSLIHLSIAYIFYKFLCKYNIDVLVNFFRILPDAYFFILTLVCSCITQVSSSIELSYLMLFLQFSVIFIVLYKLINLYKVKNLKLALSNSHLKYNKLKSVYDDIRMFKHDYNNTLCSIGGYIALNDTKGLKKFYNKLTSEINKTNTSQMLNTSTINEPSIYNLLISKYNDIIQKDLNFRFYSTIDYKKLPITPYDFSKLLGIFLDNAIDAAKKSVEKEVTLCCETNKNKNYQITIKNSYINKDVDVNKIFLKGYSSKKIKSGIRFMGSF